MREQQRGTVRFVSPCTILDDRYGGLYSGASWLAFPLPPGAYPATRGAMTTSPWISGSAHPPIPLGWGRHLTRLLLTFTHDSMAIWLAPRSITTVGRFGDSSRKTGRLAASLGRLREAMIGMANDNPLERYVDPVTILRARYGLSEGSWPVYRYSRGRCPAVHG